MLDEIYIDPSPDQSESHGLCVKERRGKDREIKNVFTPKNTTRILPKRRFVQEFCRLLTSYPALRVGNSLGELG